jgi:hypothetical protein
MEKLCIDCNEKLSVERKRCLDCVKVFNRERVKQYYKKDKPRYGIVNCQICGESMIKNRAKQVAHGKCQIAHKSIDDYKNAPRNKTGMTIAREMVLNLGFKLSANLIVHHVDENPFNNTLDNFWIIGRAKHSQLHRFLQINRSLLEKSSSSNLENCWDTLRDQLTTTWLETTNVNVIKITDIGQSAAELLNENTIYMFSQEEGSETMHQAPKTEM